MKTPNTEIEAVNPDRLRGECHSCGSKDVAYRIGAHWHHIFLCLVCAKAILALAVGIAVGTKKPNQ